MALSAAVQKTLVIKPEVNKIFDDLDKWLDHCRINLLKYDPKDLYKSKEYKEWAKTNAQHERKYKKQSKQQGN